MHGYVVWFTGLPSVGERTLASEVLIETRSILSRGCRWSIQATMIQRDVA